MTPATPLQRLPLRERIHAVLRERIVSGELAPGATVRDFEQAAELGSSRTPVREALVRLVSEGLLQSVAGRGFRVPPLRRSEVEQAHPLIVALEPLALSTARACSPGQARELERLAAKLAKAKRPTTWNELDTRWHRCLISGCSNGRLLRYVEELRDVLRRYELAYLGEAEDRHQSVAEHRAIAAAYVDGPRSGAVRRLRDHWRRGEAELLAIIPKETDS